MRTTLFVAGFGARTRARDLAYEFERYGRLIRCDIPAPKSYTAKVYAFVEFEDPHDAEDAFNEMHGQSIDGYTISVQWARNAPSASWRLGGPTTPPNPPPLPPYKHSRRRSLSPPRGRSPPPSSKRSITSSMRYHHRSRSRSPITALYHYHQEKERPKEEQEVDSFKIAVNPSYLNSPP